MTEPKTLDEIEAQLAARIHDIDGSREWKESVIRAAIQQARAEERKALREISMQLPACSDFDAVIAARVIDEAAEVTPEMWDKLAALDAREKESR
jgi:hypothetical protein